MAYKYGEIHFDRLSDLPEIVRDLKAVESGEIFEPHEVRPILKRAEIAYWSINNLRSLLSRAEERFVKGEDAETWMPQD